MPAQTEVLRDVRDSGPFDTHCRVVPADPAASDVIRCVPRIATVEGQVDAPHESDLSVDHDRLLVVTVRESGATVSVSNDLGVSCEPLEHLANILL